MTKIELNLSDDLAREAAAAGLLNELRMEAMLRLELAAKRKLDFFELTAKLHALQGEPMPMDEITAIVKEVRREMREREANDEATGR